MRLSRFSQKFLGDCGILQLMDDLGEAAQQEDTLMLGGGNPGHIPEVQAHFRRRMLRLLDSEDDFETLIGDYGAPGGHIEFIEALADLLQRESGWDVGPENFALTNGSQNAFFFLFNMFGGAGTDGVHRKILLPLAPEYIGYEDVGIDDDLFVSYRPQIEYLDDHLFKYRVNFENIEVTDDIGAICVSRPTNPTGNVLTEGEIAQLSTLAAKNDIPLIVDNAYGAPFPGIIYTEAKPIWEPHIIMCMSLSKLGLPGSRTGIVVAHERIIRAIAGMNAVISLAPGTFGATMALDMVRTGDIIRISDEIIRPHYQQKARQVTNWLHEALAGTDYHIHKPEGAFFAWLWFRDLPITSRDLYERLKARGVVVVPGQYFFPGIPDKEDWRHTQECIRVSYAGDPDVVRRGVEIIGEEIQRATRQQ